MRNIGREIDVEEWRFIGRFDPKAADNLPTRLGKNFEAAAEQPLVWLNPRIAFAEGDEHC